MADLPFTNFGTCDRCGQAITGSHYHCGGCDSTDVTSMYGHHGTHCAVTNTQRDFHHCGPSGDCEREYGTGEQS